MNNLFKKSNITQSISLFMALCLLITSLQLAVFAVSDIDPAENTNDSSGSENFENNEFFSGASSPINSVIIAEDTAKRGEYEKHFYCDDGSHLAVIYPQAVHTQVNGEWVDSCYPLEIGDNEIKDNKGITLKTSSAAVVNNDLVTINSDKYKLSWSVSSENQHNTQTYSSLEQANTLNNASTVVNENYSNTNSPDFEPTKLSTVLEAKKLTQVKISNEAKIANEQSEPAEINALSVQQTSENETNDILSLYSESTRAEINEINTIIEEYNRTIIQNVSFSEASVLYENIFGEGTTMRYVLSNCNIKEELILENPDNFTSYSMNIDADGLTAVLDESGSVYFVNEENETIIVIAAPYMYDNNYNNSFDINVKLEQTEDSCVITYAPNQTWLQSVERSYPIVIDPNILFYTKDIPQTKQLDTYINRSTNGVAVENNANLVVGYTSSENQAFWRISQEEFPVLIPGTEILNAAFYCSLHQDTTTIGPIGLYQLVQNWNSNTITWNNKPNTIVRALSVKAPGNIGVDKTLSFNITDAVKDWYNGASNCGFMLKYDYYYNDFNWIYSSDYRPNGSNAYIPNIVLRYRTPAYNTELQEGVYIIENPYNGRYLHHTSANHTVNVWSYGEKFYQQWYVQKNKNKTYSFIPLDTIDDDYRTPELSMEVYYGKTANEQPITLYNYTANLNSGARQFRLTKASDGSYIIHSALNNTKVLEVYTGSNKSTVFHNRLFKKENGMTVQLSEYTGTSNQNWIFRPLDDFEWDTSLGSGIYNIKSAISQNPFLTHVSNNNTVSVLPHNGTLTQNWKLLKNDDGTYLLSPQSNVDLYLEVYCGVNQNGQPLTVYNYTNNKGSPYIRFHLINHGNGSFSISPLTAPTRVLDVHTGTELTFYYNNRTFTKIPEKSVHLWDYYGDSNQIWIFNSINIPLSGIEPIRSLVEVDAEKTLNLNSFIKLIPSNTTDVKVTYLSENPYIATVDSSGIVTGHLAGKTAITITSEKYPNISIKIYVKVNAILRYPDTLITHNGTITGLRQYQTLKDETTVAYLTGKISNEEKLTILNAFEHQMDLIRAEYIIAEDNYKSDYAYIKMGGKKEGDNPIPLRRNLYYNPDNLLTGLDVIVIQKVLELFGYYDNTSDSMYGIWDLQTTQAAKLISQNTQNQYDEQYVFNKDAFCLLLNDNNKSDRTYYFICMMRAFRQQHGEVQNFCKGLLESIGYRAEMEVRIYYDNNTKSKEGRKYGIADLMATNIYNPQGTYIWEVKHKSKWGEKAGKAQLDNYKKLCNTYQDGQTVMAEKKLPTPIEYGFCLFTSPTAISYNDKYLLITEKNSLIFYELSDYVPSEYKEAPEYADVKVPQSTNGTHFSLSSVITTMTELGDAAIEGIHIQPETGEILLVLVIAGAVFYLGPGAVLLAA